MKSIAIIPARGGSKRIPHKNRLDFLGKPIICYSILAALSSGIFEEVMVSTDDEVIAALARECGAQVPFMRSAKNAGDFSTTSAVLCEVLENYESAGKSFDLGCCIYPTAPFISEEILRETQHLLLENHFDTVFPVTKFETNVQRALQIKDGKISMLWPEFREKRSQDLPDSYFDAGQFYWFRTEKIKCGLPLFTENSGTVVLNNMHVQDINTPDDWKLAELKYQIYLQRDKTKIM